jgi:3-hydroxybutyryl-CoA dehydrogenase
MAIESVAVLGMGSLGRGVVERFSSAGFTVRGYDNSARRLTAVKRWLQEIRTLLVATGMVEPEKRNTAVRMTALGLDLKDAIHGVDLIIDASDEFTAAQRRELRGTISAEAQDSAVIALDSEIDGIARIPDLLQDRLRRMAGIRWYQPVSTLRRAEVEFPGTADDSVRSDLFDALKRAGIQASPATRDGVFDAGVRLRLALIREALALIAEGKCAPAQVETAAKELIGPQTAAAGVFGYMAAMGPGRVSAWIERDWRKLSASRDVPEHLGKILAQFTEYVSGDAEDEKGLPNYERVLARLLMFLHPEMKSEKD